MGERILRVVIVPALALAAAVAVGMVFLAATGYPAAATFRAIVRESFQDWYGFGQVLRSATLLTFTGLAVAVAFQAGLFNIGAEGQLTIGAVCAGIAGHHLRLAPPGALDAVPWVLWLVLFCGVAMLGAGLWAAVPGALRAATGAHEVITTIMMNFIAFALVNYLLRPDPASFAVPATRHTASVPQFVRVPRLSASFGVFEGSTVSWTILLAVAAAIGVWAMLRFTRFGFELRAVGRNPAAARLAGISPGRITVAAMLLSGALTGLVGIDFVLGYKGYFEEGFSAGLGFLGIAVALLAGNHPIGVLFTAFLFAVLDYGKVSAAGTVPKDIIEIMEGVIILAVLLGNRVMNQALAAAHKRRASTAASRPAVEMPDPLPDN
jgi:simple sugar transport system permease protein